MAASQSSKTVRLDEIISLFNSFDSTRSFEDFLDESGIRNDLDRGCDIANDLFNRSLTTEEYSITGFLARNFPERIDILSAADMECVREAVVELDPSQGAFSKIRLGSRKVQSQLEILEKISTTSLMVIHHVIQGEHKDSFQDAERIVTILRNNGSFDMILSIVWNMKKSEVPLVCELIRNCPHLRNFRSTKFSLKSKYACAVLDELTARLQTDHDAKVDEDDGGVSFVIYCRYSGGRDIIETCKRYIIEYRQYETLLNLSTEDDVFKARDFLLTTKSEKIRVANGYYGPCTIRFCKSKYTLTWGTILRL